MASNGPVTAINNSYELLKEELIREAIHNDIQKDFVFESYEVIDFTKPGDNYTGIVTSVKVNINVDEEEVTKSYIAKLNPQRNLGPFAELVDAGFTKEAYILSDISIGMNKELKKTDECPLRLPNLYSKSLDKGKEILLLKDLRKFTENGEEKKFKMFDRKVAMDVDHASLVMKELGRLHASSLLYENTLEDKIETVHTCFKESWTVPGSELYVMFEQMFASQYDGTVQILSKYPEYEKSLNFVKRNKDSFTQQIFAMVLEKGKFSVLNHGDCWNNNILFRYSDADDALPVETMFVDLQMSRTCSAACDLNYFIYASLDGETRKKHVPFLLDIYYSSFEKILTLAGKQVPFSCDQLKSEFKDKLLYGCLMGMFLLPIVLAEEDKVMNFENMETEEGRNAHFKERHDLMQEISNKSDSMKTRFLSMFDELNEAKLLDQ